MAPSFSWPSMSAPGLRKSTQFLEKSPAQPFSTYWRLAKSRLRKAGTGPYAILFLKLLPARLSIIHLTTLFLGTSRGMQKILRMKIRCHSQQSSLWIAKMQPKIGIFFHSKMKKKILEILSQTADKLRPRPISKRKRFKAPMMHWKTKILLWPQSK